MLKMSPSDVKTDITRFITEQVHRDIEEYRLLPGIDRYDENRI